MLNYAICEIAGKQVKILPKQEIVVDCLDGEQKSIEANVLILAEDGKIKIGKPYLKEKLTLKVVDHTRGKKIRVSKYHAKANYRRVRGSRPKYTKLLLT